VSHEEWRRLRFGSKNLTGKVGILLVAIVAFDFERYSKPWGRQYFVRLSEQDLVARRSVLTIMKQVVLAQYNPVILF